MVEGHVDAKLRQLATYERFRIALHDLGFHNSVSIVAFCLSPFPRLESAHLAKALSECIKQHPALSLQVREADTEAPFFIRLPKITLSDLIEWQSPSELSPHSDEEQGIWIENLLSNEASTGFAYNDRPLWRIRIASLGHAENMKDLYRHAIIFSWHHVIADGMSGQAMIYSILEALNAMNTEDVAESLVDDVIVPPASELLPSMDDVFTYPTSWSTRLRSSVSFLDQKDDNTGRWAGASHRLPPEGAAKTLVKLLELSAIGTDALLQLSRKEHTSITGLLQTLVADCLFARLDDAEIQLRCASAIQLRRCITEYNIDESKMGVWIDAWHQDFDRATVMTRKRQNDVLSWDVARENKKRITHEISNGQYDREFRFLKGQTGFRQSLPKVIGKERQNSYSIVNLGICKERSAANDRWTLERMALSQSAHVNGSAIQFGFVSTTKGGMTISAQWQEGVVSRDFVNGVFQNLEATLAALIKTG